MQTHEPTPKADEPHAPLCPSATERAARRRTQRARLAANRWVRTKTRRRIGLLLLMMLMTACDGLGHGNQGSGLGGSTPGPVCPKDREALSQLLVQPQSCSTTASCPGGSFCDPDLSVCDWECYTDSDCASQGTCSCKGLCIDEDAPLPPSHAASDPACPRDEDVLAALNTEPRSCVHDEHCPFGSHCDRGTGLCAFECLGTDHLESGCAPDKVCDCQGVCANEGEAPLRTTGARPTLVLSDKVLTFSTPPAAPMVVELSLTIAQDSGIDPDAERNLTLLPPEAFSLSSDSTSGGPGEAITVDNWAFQAEGDFWVAKQEVQIRVAGPLTPSESPWALQVSGDGLADGRQSVVLALESTKAPVGVSGIYEGMATLQVDNEDPDRDPPAMVPLRAFVSDSEDGRYIVFSDSTRSFSSEMHFGMPYADGTSQNVSWLQNRDGEDTMVASVRMKAAPTASADGTLEHGVLELILPATPSEPLAFQVNLRKLGELTQPACQNDGDCTEDTYCDSGLLVCVPGKDWRTTAPFGNRTAHDRARAWRDGASWMQSGQAIYGDVVDVHWGERLLCYDKDDTQVGNIINDSGLSPSGGVGADGSTVDILYASGEANCDDQRLPRSLSLGLQRDAAEREAYAELGAAELFRLCMDELRRPVTTHASLPLRTIFWAPGRDLRSFRRKNP